MHYTKCLKEMICAVFYNVNDNDKRLGFIAKADQPDDSSPLNQVLN